MPKPEKAFISYTNYYKEIDVPFTIYADFECILEKVDDRITSKTCNVQKHVPYAFSYYIKCSFNDELDVFRMHCGADSPKVFVENIIKDAKDIYHKYLKKNSFHDKVK